MTGSDNTSDEVPDESTGATTMATGQSETAVCEQQRREGIDDKAHNANQSRMATGTVQNQKEDDVRAPEDTSSDDQCPDCSGELTVNKTRGEAVCRNCDLVVDADRIDHGPEWRAFSSEERRTKRRTGPPATNRRHDDRLPTTIGYPGEGSRDSGLSSRQRARISRLRTWNERIKTNTSRERSVRSGLGEIERISSALGASDTLRETASQVFRQAANEGLLKAYSIDAVAAAALYVAYRIQQIPQTPQAVGHLAQDEQQRIDAAIRRLSSDLGLELPPYEPREYLDQFVTNLDGCSGITKAEAQVMLDLARETNYRSGKSPSALAAGAVFAGSLLALESVDVQELADLANTTENTIRHHQKHLARLAAANEQFVMNKSCPSSAQNPGAR